MTSPLGEPRVSARFPDLAGKTALVTGASRGIGCGIAEFLGRQGMKLALSARSAEAGEAFAANLRAAGVDGFFVAADRGGGCIVNISSVGGKRPHHELVGYDASKGAMDAMTRGMAIDLARYGIRVNSVAPGLTHSHPLRPEWAQKYQEKLQGIPLGRAGTVEEIGAAVAFLASDAAAYITGQVLYVDGGLTTQLTPPGIHI